MEQGVTGGPAARQHQVAFYGRGGEYFGIWIVNLLLTILTLGIYSAWAKVRKKRYFYGNTELAGDRFEYHAKPKQILIGRIIAVVLFIAWIGLGGIHPYAQLALFLIGISVLPVLVARNLGFDARVSSYRGVRFDFTGTIGRAYLVFLLYPLLGLIGLGT